MGPFYDGWWGLAGMHVLSGVAMWMLFGLLVWVLLRPRSGKSPEETALEMLNKRYARGDISREEYVRKKGDLEG